MESCDICFAAWFASETLHLDGSGGKSTRFFIGDDTVLVSNAARTISRSMWFLTVNTFSGGCTRCLTGRFVITGTNETPNLLGTVFADVAKLVTLITEYNRIEYIEYISLYRIDCAVYYQLWRKLFTDKLHTESI